LRIYTLLTTLAVEPSVPRTAAKGICD
jgi:hypothetical protein